MPGGQAISQQKICGDFDAQVAAVYVQHLLEGIFYFSGFQGFVDVGKGSGIGRLEADVDIGVKRNPVEGLKQIICGIQQRICTAE